MAVVPVRATKTVTTAGTQVQLTTSNVIAQSLYIEALATNTGYIYVGLSDVDSTTYIARLSAGQGFSISADVQRGIYGSGLDVSAIWIDSSVNGEKAQWTYLPVVGSD